MVGETAIRGLVGQDSEAQEPDLATPRQTNCHKTMLMLVFKMVKKCPRTFKKQKVDEDKDNSYVKNNEKGQTNQVSQCDAN